MRHATLLLVVLVLTSAIATGGCGSEAGDPSALDPTAFSTTDEYANVHLRVVHPKATLGRPMRWVDKQLDAELIATPLNVLDGARPAFKNFVNKGEKIVAVRMRLANASADGITLTVGATWFVYCSNRKIYSAVPTFQMVKGPHCLASTFRRELRTLGMCPSSSPRR